MNAAHQNYTTMKKIKCVFQRPRTGDRATDSLVTDAVTPGAEWVAAGEGVATRKYDGTCCLVRDGKLYKRYDAKTFTLHGGVRQEWNRKPPAGFEPAQEPDEITGHWPGWIPVGEGPEDQWHREAWAASNIEAWTAWDASFLDGTYELCGPKLQGNPEGFVRHILVPHGTVLLEPSPRDYAGLKAWLAGKDIEGVVWHHHDGRMVKLRLRDMGLSRVC